MACVSALDNRTTYLLEIRSPRSSCRAVSRAMVICRRWYWAGTQRFSAGPKWPLTESDLTALAAYMKRLEVNNFFNGPAALAMAFNPEFTTWVRA
jgi:hypothetical protein